MSTAEPELGLGLVLEADRRQVRLFFPASEETRIYSADSAPISRVSFKTGDRVRTQEQTSSYQVVRNLTDLFTTATA
jgi:ATP-dependent helicase HepA